jgi:hypothetical protein
VPSQLDPDDLEATLRVLAQLNEIDEQHPDFVAVRRATAKMFKAVKQSRRLDARARDAAADRAVVAATATGAPDRIDDETRGIPISTSTTAPTAGILRVPRACYICKQDYTVVDAFYHQLCPSCAAMSHAKSDARTDLTGKRALLTGGRAKIGMYIALRLLRDGAHTTITTRFPRDAVRRFTAMPDSAEWILRLRVVGIDLRDPAQVIALAESVAEAGPLDILINNATQTVRRSPGAYQPLVDAELAPLPDGPLPELVTFGHTNDAHPLALERSVAAHPILAAAASAAARADELTAQALAPGSTSLERLAAGTAIDAGGLLPDLHHENSWTQAVHEVDHLGLRTARQGGGLGADELRVGARRASYGLRRVVDEYVQRALGRDLVGQRHHLLRVTQVDADDAQPVQPVGAVRHGGEPSYGVVGEARGDGGVGTVAEEAERDVHADLGAAAGEQGTPVGEVGAGLAPGPVELRAGGAQLVVEGVHLLVALLADVAGAGAVQDTGDGGGRARAERQAAGLVVDPVGRGRGGGGGDGRVGGQLLHVPVTAPAHLHRLEQPGRRPSYDEGVGMVDRQVVELGEHLESGRQLRRIDAGHSHESTSARIRTFRRWRGERTPPREEPPCRTAPSSARSPSPPPRSRSPWARPERPARSSTGQQRPRARTRSWRRCRTAPASPSAAAASSRAAGCSPRRTACRTVTPATSTS